MCNAYNLRHREAAILDIARALQFELPTEFPNSTPLFRIGIKQRGLILRPVKDGALAWSWARWSLIPPFGKDMPPYPLNNARADKLSGWPVSNDNVCRRKPTINQIARLSQQSIQYSGGAFIHHRDLLNDPMYVLAFRQHKICRIDLGAMNVGFHLGEGETDPLIVEIARPGSRLGDQVSLWNQICNGRHNGCQFKQWSPVDKCLR